jgi:hypothetical protein
MGRAALAARRDRGKTAPVRHPELLLGFAAAIAVALAHLRWIVLTQWTCRTCGTTHLECECKPAWVKKLL